MYKEMKLMGLAKLIYETEEDTVIDFASGTENEVVCYGGWMGVKNINPFDNDNPIYLVGHYGGEADTWLYHISEYDDRIGDFCAKELHVYDWRDITDQSYINCIGRILVDVFERFEGEIPEIITVEI